MLGRRISFGWLPVEVKLHQNAPIIEWIDFGNVCLSEPFFHQTAQRVYRNQRHTNCEQSNFAFVSTLAESVETAQPCCFIFHISRCGSTLIANAFRTVQSRAVVSEAQAITVLFTPYNSGRWPYAPDQWEQQRDVLLRSMIQVFGQRRTGKEENLVVKFTSWNILFLPLVRSLWPTVPCLLVIRDPLEVMLSNLSRPSGWMRRESMQSFSRGLFGWAVADLENMTSEEYCARVIGAFCQAATMALDSKCIVVDYKEIDAGTLCELISHCGSQITSFERDAILRSTDVYSKYIVAGSPLRNVWTEKQFAATDKMREATERWATPFYNQIRKAGKT